MFQGITAFSTNCNTNAQHDNHGRSQTAGWNISVSQLDIVDLVWNRHISTNLMWFWLCIVI